MNIELFPPEDPKLEIEEEEEFLVTPKHGEQFEIFWQGYPRAARGPRAAAVRIWNKLPLTDKLIAKVILGLQRHIRSKKWVSEPKFIPHARTWLNQHRWQDEVEPNEDMLRLKQYWKDCTTPKQKQYFIENYGEPEKLGIL
jgi:hypothetical protein